jgi:glycosyltransferase involved in cell wall biosynthesis
VDKHCPSPDFNPENLVTMDTGGDLSANIRDLEKMISQNPDVKISMIFNPERILNAGYTPEQFLDDLDGSGLDICFIDDREGRVYRYDPSHREGYLTILKEFSTLNLLCCKKGRYPLVQIFSHSARMAGGEQSLLNMVDAMLLKGYLVHVTLSEHGPLEDELWNRSVSCDYVNIPLWIHGAGRQPEEYVACLSEQIPLAVSASLEINPHLIISNTSVIAHGALVALITGKPHFWRISEFGLPEYGIKYLFDDVTRKEFITSTSDKVLFSSKTLEQDYAGYLADHQSVIISPGIFIAEPPDPGPVSFVQDKTWSVIYPAHILPGKRQEDVIRALIILKEKGFRRFKVTFFGTLVDPAYHQQLISLINEGDVGSEVFFKPFTENILREYMDADMVVSSSLMESFGRIIIEGMACGKIVVGAASGGTLELITHNETGLLFEPGNASDLAEKLIYAVTHSQEIDRMAENAREFSRRFFGSGCFTILPDLISDCIGPERNTREIDSSVPFFIIFIPE